MATILIVDDRPANCEFMVSLLGYAQHRLLLASDGAEALALARAERPDLVIADILMPTMDGYELVRQLRPDVLRDRGENWREADPLHGSSVIDAGPAVVPTRG